MVSLPYIISKVHQIVHNHKQRVSQMERGHIPELRPTKISLTGPFYSELQKHVAAITKTCGSHNGTAAHAGAVLYQLLDQLAACHYVGQ